MLVVKPTHRKRHNALRPLSTSTCGCGFLLFFQGEIFHRALTCFSSMVGLPQLSVAALWQPLMASFSAQGFQGIIRAAWTAAGEFNSQLALVGSPQSGFPSSLSVPLLTSLHYQQWNSKHISSFQGSTCSFWTSPQSPSTTTWRCGVGAWKRERWLIGSAAQWCQALCSAPPMRPRSSSIVTIPKTSLASTLSIRVRRKAPSSFSLKSLISHIFLIAQQLRSRFFVFLD